MEDSLDTGTVEAALRPLRGRLGPVTVVARTGSTSSDLAAASGDLPDRSVLVADHQAKGRGRAGRVWQTPPGTALTFSVLLRPPVPASRVGWLPLLGGLAVVRALRGHGLGATLKWPNDVLLPAPGWVPGWGERRKVAGVLGELVAAPGADAVAVLGIGVNVGQDDDALPVPSATSLALAGLARGRADLLADVLGVLLEVDDRWRAASGDAEAAGLAAECAAVCSTLGAAVRVHRPGGDVVEGTAVALAPDGALRVRTGAGETTVMAGDVENLRM